MGYHFASLAVYLEMLKSIRNLKSLKAFEKYLFNLRWGMEDAIGSACASLARRKHHVKFQPSMALGPTGGSDEEISELKAEYQNLMKFEFFEDSDLINKMVSELKKDKVVGLVRGRLEFGPRALCQRSILYKTSDASCNDWLNKRMNRTEFMPFAPVMTSERAGDYLLNFSKTDLSFLFMTSTVEVSKEFGRLCPAVTHVDNTARPQVVLKIWIHGFGIYSIVGMKSQENQH